MDDTFSYRSYETFVGISPPILGSLRRQRYYEVDIICGTVSFLMKRDFLIILKLIIETATSK